MSMPERLTEAEREVLSRWRRLERSNQIAWLEILATLEKAQGHNKRRVNGSP